MERIADIGGLKLGPVTEAMQVHIGHYMPVRLLPTHTMGRVDDFDKLAESRWFSLSQRPHI